MMSLIPFPYLSLNYIVPFMYLITLFTTCQCSFLGLLQYRLKKQTGNPRLGRVYIMAYIKHVGLILDSSAMSTPRSKGVHVGLILDIPKLCRTLIKYSYWLRLILSFDLSIFIPKRKLSFPRSFILNS